MFRTVIMDDDPISQEALRDLLADHFPDFDIVAIFSGVKDSCAELPAMEVDLVLLDMELLDGKGFDVLENLVDIDFEVIITTMHDSYMLQAIKHAALDYLMKPIDKEVLRDALERFRSKFNKIQELARSRGKAVKSRLVIPVQDGLLLLNISDIIRLESDGSYTKVYMRDGSDHLISKNLGHYEDLLIQHDFVRIHHRHLINMEYVRQYLKTEGGAVEMMDGSIVEVSRRKKEDFLHRLGLA